MTRDEFISCFQIKEAPLQQLVNDLMAQPDTPNNRYMLHKALRGVYSAEFNTFILALDSRSRVSADSLLLAHLRIIMKTEPQYDALHQKASNKGYKHTHGATKIKDYEDSEEFANAATVAKPARISREQFLAPYSSPEKGYNNLIRDLLSLPATEVNYTLLEECVRGQFSDFHSDTLPSAALIELLGIAKEDDPAYEPLVLKAITGGYDHNYSPLKNGERQNPLTMDDVVNSAREWIKRDMEKEAEAEMDEEGPSPGFF
ncbi:hypothetical protein [Legionella shakespearei]|uniref:Uncharacterized protein n=1 Tax=Legionella shakespearei DSM 23087 TaxID=1122169 RepID=A0A0W0YWL9_9GAMM|nr:hypothetical protein [Legionella shakespearei]KTD61281.1 hypothetical protein Lsha_1254 [Legionella shakespearei DSM 23087]